jgi:hypothetical protein
MRAILFALSITLFIAAAQAQQDQLLHFGYTENSQQMDEIASVIRAISDMKEVTVNPTQRVIEVRGTPEQVSLAAWVFSELDQGQNSQRPTTQNDAVTQYKIPGGGDNTVRIFYLPYTKTVQEFQEVVTLVKAITGTGRVFTFNGTRAVALRGTADQSTAAEWFFTQLGKPAVPSVAPQFRMPGSSDEMLEIVHAPNTPSVKEFQEVAIAIRGIADFKRLFTYNAPRSIAVRGSAEQLALAEWLAAQLDPNASAATASKPYEFPDLSENAVQVFYLPASTTSEQFRETVVSVRNATGIRKAFTYDEIRALVVRGTPQQIAQAGQLIAERRKLI